MYEYKNNYYPYAATLRFQSQTGAASTFLWQQITFPNGPNAGPS